MTILYVAMKYDYGNPEQGLSFEHCNFFDALRHMGHDILYFDFMTLLQQQGQDAMNRRLREVARSEKPELTFTFLFADEIYPETIRALSDSGDTTTFNWFADDHWRFDDFSSRYAPCFHWVATTAKSALARYASIGFESVILSQWACNPFLYRKTDGPMTYDVTFVGQAHGNRPAIVQALRAAGFDVQVWGRGWDTGRASQEDMVRIFNQSRINLNLSNASVPVAGPAASAPGVSGASVLGGVRRVLRRVPLARRVYASVRQAVRSGLPSPTREDLPVERSAAFLQQIKGRNFEVPGCGGFLLTDPAENLSDYYDIGREIVTFTTTNELLEKVRYYLDNEEERRAVAQAGYERTIREHTYIHRFHAILHRLGLPCDAPEALLRGETLSRIEEIV